MTQPLQSESVDKIIPAFLAARKQIGHALIDSTNPHYKSKFASLESVVDATTPILMEQEIVPSQQTVTIDGQPHVATTLYHVSGQWIRSFTQVHFTDNKNPAQAQGGGLSYARRYALLAMMGIGERDDDGNSAYRPPETAQKPPEKKEAPRAPQSKAAPSRAGDFKITFGKRWPNKTIAEAVAQDGLPELQRFVRWLEDQADKDGKPLSENARFLKVNLERYANELKAKAGPDANEWQRDSFDTDLDQALARNGGR